MSPPDESPSRDERELEGAVSELAERVRLLQRLVPAPPPGRLRRALRRALGYAALAGLVLRGAS